MTWDFTNLLNEARKRLVAQSRRVQSGLSLQEKVERWLYVHPSTEDQLCCLLPSAMTAESKRVTVSRIVTKACDAEKVLTIGRACIPGFGREREVFAGVPYFCRNGQASAALGELVFCFDPLVLHDHRKLDAKCSMSVKHSDLATKLAVTQLALSMPGAWWIRTTGNSADKPADCILCEDATDGSQWSAHTIVVPVEQARRDFVEAIEEALSKPSSLASYALLILPSEQDIADLAPILRWPIGRFLTATSLERLHDTIGSNTLVIRSDSRDIHIRHRTTTRWAF